MRQYFWGGFVIFLIFLVFLVASKSRQAGINEANLTISQAVITNQKATDEIRTKQQKITSKPDNNSDAYIRDWMRLVAEKTNSTNSR
tara:strand:- start:622 stop:882 length:261 start_codon:yes stop_codon:yes gene_type:complete